MKKSLIDMVRDPLIFDSGKHGLYREYGFDDPEEHVDSIIQKMDNLELLRTISDALENS